jgi:hypothetical protein
LAFYHSGRRDGRLILTDQFWVNTNGNFLDILVLEWCKLLADRNSKHHWRKVVTEQEDFLNGLLSALKMNEEELLGYIQEMRTYRDKFIAHLDEMPKVNIPHLNTAKESVVYLYDYLLSNEEENACFHDAPENATTFYQRFEKVGQETYRKHKT